MSQAKQQQLALLGTALNMPVNERTEQQRHAILNATAVDFRRALNLSATTKPGGDEGEPPPIAAETFEIATLRDRVASGHAEQSELDAALALSLIHI